LHYQANSQFNNQAVYPPSNFHHSHQQWQSSPYCAEFEDNRQPSSTYRSPQQQSQATQSPPMSSDFQDQMLKFMGKMDQIIDSQNQMVNSHSESIAKIEDHEDEPSPIYWPP
jgi:hypothetical protein